MLEQDLDLVADLEVGMILELFERNGALGLEADVEHDHVVADLQDRGLDDLAFFDRGHRALVHLHHLVEFSFIGQIVLVVQLGAAVGERAQLRLLHVALLARRQERSGGSAVTGFGVGSEGGRVGGFELRHIGQRIS